MLAHMPHANCETALKASHGDPNDLRLLVEAQAAVRLVAIPKPEWLPDSSVVSSLLGSHDQAARPREFLRQVKDDACIHAGNEKFVCPELPNQRRAVGVFRAECGPAIGLRKTESNRGLPLAGNPVPLLSSRAPQQQS